MHRANPYVTVVSSFSYHSQHISAVSYSSSPIFTVLLASRIKFKPNATYLGREVKAQVTASRQGILDQERHFIRETDLDRV